MRLRCGLVSLLAVVAGAICALSALPAAASAAECPNEALRTGPSANLPDCRAYELVTPADKGSATDLFDETGSDSYAAVSPEGNALLLYAFAKWLPNVNGFSTFYRFSRSASGWQIADIKPPASGTASYLMGAKVGNERGIWNPDFSQVAVAVNPNEEESTEVLYQAGPFGGPYATLAGPVTGEGLFLGGIVPPDTLVDGTPDFSHLLLESADHTLAPGAAGTVAGAQDVYDYTGGSLHLVNVNTDGSLVSPCGAGYAQLSKGNGTPGIGPRKTAGEGLEEYVPDDEAGGWMDFANTISSDGSKVFFQSPDPYALANGATDPSCSEPTQLYMRDQATGTTVEVSAPQGGIVDPNGPQPAYFVGASADGSKVFFITKAELTPDDAGIHDTELYEYDTLTGKLTRVTRGSSGTADANLREGDIMAIARDGSTVYYQSQEALTPGAASAAPEYTNLYRYDTETGATTYVATAEQSSVSGADSELTLPYTTPNGRFLLFESQEVLGGPAAARGNQVYRYDSADGSLICVSCRPDGSPSQGSSFASSVFAVLSGAKNVEHSHPANPITADGRYVFFASNDELVSQDTNGVKAAPEKGETANQPNTDVYEWEADGTGGCTVARGCVHLLSSGTSGQVSYFLGASENGSNVFIGTHSQLAPQDPDELGDAYDLRVDGGFPPPSSTAGCAGEGCQGPVAQAPSLLAPASVGFNGPGDVTPVQPSSHHKPQAKHRNKNAKRRRKLRHALKRCKRMHRHNRSKQRRCRRQARRRLGARAARAHKHRRSGGRR